MPGTRTMKAGVAVASSTQGEYLRHRLAVERYDGIYEKRPKIMGQVSPRIYKQSALGDTPPLIAYMKHAYLEPSVPTHAYNPLGEGRPQRSPE